MADWNPIALTSMHHRHAALGAEMADSIGWQRPAKYTDVEDEVAAIRSTVGLFDISPDGKVTVHATDMDGYMRAAFHEIPDPTILEFQQAQVMLEEGPATVGVARLAHDELLVTTFTGQAAAAARFLDEAGWECGHTVDVTSVFAGVQMIGPQARDLLSALTETDVSEQAFPNMSCSQSKVSEIGTKIIRRDVRGLLSFDLYFPREYGEYMWDSLVHAGDHFAATPAGTEAVRRIEAGG